MLNRCSLSMPIQHNVFLIFLSSEVNIVKFCWQLYLVSVVVVPVLEVLLQRHRGHGRQTRGPRRQHQHAAGQQSGPRLERVRRVRIEMLTYIPPWPSSSCWQPDMFSVTCILLYTHNMTTCVVVLWCALCCWMKERAGGEAGSINWCLFNEIDKH